MRVCVCVPVCAAVYSCVSVCGCVCKVCAGRAGRGVYGVRVGCVLGGAGGGMYGGRAGCVLGGTGARRRVYDVRAGVCYVLCSLRV